MQFLAFFNQNLCILASDTVFISFSFISYITYLDPSLSFQRLVKAEMNEYICLQTLLFHCL